MFVVIGMLILRYFYHNFISHILGSESNNKDNKSDVGKENNNTDTIGTKEEEDKIPVESDVKMELAQQPSPVKQMSFSNRILMNQLENPRELAQLPNLTPLPKYQLETATKIADGSTIASGEGDEPAVEQLQLEAKRHQQIHMLIKLSR